MKRNFQLFFHAVLFRCKRYLVDLPALIGRRILQSVHRALLRGRCNHYALALDESIEVGKRNCSAHVYGEIRFRNGTNLPIVSKADRIEIERGIRCTVIDATERGNGGRDIFVKIDRNLIPAFAQLRSRIADPRPTLSLLHGELHLTRLRSVDKKIALIERSDRDRIGERHNKIVVAVYTLLRKLAFERILAVFYILRFFVQFVARMIICVRRKGCPACHTLKRNPFTFGAYVTRYLLFHPFLRFALAARRNESYGIITDRVKRKRVARIHLRLRFVRFRHGNFEGSV